MNTLRITLKTQKGFINEHKLKFYMEKAVELIFKAAVEISETPSQN
jgi:hypothetical protein